VTAILIEGSLPHEEYDCIHFWLCRNAYKLSYDVLGAINPRWKARIDGRNYINGFDMFAVPGGEGKLEKIFFKKSSNFLPFQQEELN